LRSHEIDELNGDFRWTSQGAADMAVTYVIKFTVRPAQVQPFLALLGEVLDTMRSEASFREAHLNRDPQDPAKFLLYETWADHDDVVNVQMHRSYRQAYHDALPDLLAEPRDITIWEPLRSDRQTATV
jgi:quinol monooxygenase YgiN